MDEDIIQQVARVSLFSRVPKWIKIILIITIVYWLCIFLYKFWIFTGRFIHFISEENNWKLYASCILLLLIGGLVVAELYSDLNPFSNFVNGVKDFIKSVRESLGNTIKGG